MEMPGLCSGNLCQAGSLIVNADECQRHAGAPPDHARARIAKRVQLELALAIAFRDAEMSWVHAAGFWRTVCCSCTAAGL